MQVATLEEHQELVNKYEALRREVELIYLAVTFSGWVHHTKAQQILKVASLRTLKEWRDRGELEMKQVSERNYEVSVLSIASRLLENGFKLETVAQRLAA